MNDDEEFQSALNEFEGAPPKQQEKHGSRVLNLAARWAAQRKATPRDAIEESLNRAVVSQNWPEAERIARQLIAMQESPILAYRDWDRLASILELQERMDEAYEASMESCQAARQSDMRPIILNALHTEAAWALRRDEDERALQCIQEGLAQAEEGGSIYTQLAASFLVQHAKLLLKTGELDEANARLDAAEAILRPYADTNSMTGPLSTLRNWGFTNARVRLKRQDIAGAREANQTALELGMRIGTFPHLEPLVRQHSLHNTQLKFDEIQKEIEQAS